MNANCRLMPEGTNIMARKNKEMTGRDFEALPEAEKRRIVDELERMTPEELIAQSRPLTKAEAARERGMRRAAKARLGRPVVGQGSRHVAVTLERGLLQRADEYAKRRGLKRSEMIAAGLNLLMAS
jgi:hypothetical protein